MASCLLGAVWPQPRCPPACLVQCGLSALLRPRCSVASAEWHLTGSGGSDDAVFCFHACFVKQHRMECATFTESCFHVSGIGLPFRRRKSICEGQGTCAGRRGALLSQAAERCSRHMCFEVSSVGVCAPDCWRRPLCRQPRVHSNAVPASSCSASATLPVVFGNGIKESKLTDLWHR